MVEYKNVQSSNVAAIGYDPQEKCVYVRFLAKKASACPEYKYVGVEQEVFDEIMDAPSKGNAIHRLLKGRYEFQKI